MFHEAFRNCIALSIRIIQRRPELQNVNSDVSRGLSILRTQRQCLFASMSRQRVRERCLIRRNQHRQANGKVQGFSDRRLAAIELRRSLNTAWSL